MPNYDAHTLLLYLEKKLSQEKISEISRALKKDSLFLAQVMELSRINSLSAHMPSEIAVALIKGEEKIFTAGAVNFLRRDLVQLRGLPRPMTHSFFATETLKIGLTRTGEDYVLNISGPRDSPLVVKSKGGSQSHILGESELFLRLPPGQHTLAAKTENIRLSLA